MTPIARLQQCRTPAEVAAIVGSEAGVFNCPVEWWLQRAFPMQAGVRVSGSGYATYVTPGGCWQRIDLGGGVRAFVEQWDVMNNMAQQRRQEVDACLPWMATGGLITDTKGEAVARTELRHNSGSNARKIVRVMNGHAGLVAALKRLMNASESGITNDDIEAAADALEAVGEL